MDTSSLFVAFFGAVAVAVLVIAFFPEEFSRLLHGLDEKSQSDKLLEKMNQNITARRAKSKVERTE